MTHPSNQGISGNVKKLKLDFEKAKENKNQNSGPNQQDNKPSY